MESEAELCIHCLPFAPRSINFYQLKFEPLNSTNRRTQAKKQRDVEEKLGEGSDPQRRPVKCCARLFSEDWQKRYH